MFPREPHPFSLPALDIYIVADLLEKMRIKRKHFLLPSTNCFQPAERCTDRFLSSYQPRLKTKSSWARTHEGQLRLTWKQLPGAESYLLRIQLFASQEPEHLVSRDKTGSRLTEPPGPASTRVHPDSNSFCPFLEVFCFVLFSASPHVQTLKPAAVTHPGISQIYATQGQRLIYFKISFI